MPVDNKKYTARVPIVPDSFQNKQDHKDKELVMDFDNNDLYIFINGGYINITGQIRDAIKDIQDGSVVVHVVTEDTLPPIKDRERNHWYYVIESAEPIGGDKDTVAVTNYIYYGVVENEYYGDNNYLLIGQNVFTGTQTVKVTIGEGYTACFYVPVNLEPRFTNADSGESFSYNLVDRIYALNTTVGSYVAYDVYMLEIPITGDYNINVDISGTDYYTITFSSNYPDIPGLTLPDDIEVQAGDVIGTIADPIWGEPRYTFMGWSTSSVIYTPIDPLRYEPESSMQLFAWFEFNASTNMIGTYSTYISSTNNAPSAKTYSSLSKAVSNNMISLMSLSDTKEAESSNKDSGITIIQNPTVIGQSCSMVNVDEVVMPKTIEGYNKPEGQVATEDNEHLVFVYDPIKYNISYVLDGGEFNDFRKSILKTEYTIEDTYTPPKPEKKNYTFKGWQPEKIEKGTTGDIIFTAAWKAFPVTVTGKRLREIISTIGQTAGIDEDISDQVMAIQKCNTKPTTNDNAVNISSTTTPIYAWYVDSSKSINLYWGDETPYCNDDMSGAFENMINLRDISALYYFKCNEGTNIENLFSGCILLTNLDPVTEWANGNFSNFDNAFKDTNAITVGRVPSWYRWNATIDYTSVKGPVLETSQSQYIPGQVVYPKKFTAYQLPKQTITIDEPDKTYRFDYNPVEYDIKYILNGGIMAGGKTKYTIDDETYFPPQPIRDGYDFMGWIPEYIPKGEYGNITFVAKWKANIPLDNPQPVVIPEKESGEEE